MPKKKYTKRQVETKLRSAEINLGLLLNDRIQNSDSYVPYSVKKLLDIVVDVQRGHKKLKK
jgi:hypothetical protein